MIISLDIAHKKMIDSVSRAPRMTHEDIVKYFSSARMVSQMLDTAGLKLYPYAYYYIVSIESAVLCGEMGLEDINSAYTYCVEIANNFKIIGGLFS